MDKAFRTYTRATPIGARADAHRLTPRGERLRRACVCDPPLQRPFRELAPRTGFELWLRRGWRWSGGDAEGFVLAVEGQA